MILFDIVQLYLGIATLVAALTIIQYSRRRSSELSPDERSAFKPLYVVSIAFIILGIGMIGTFIESTLGIVLLLDTYLAYYVCAALEVILLGVASAMIMKVKTVYALPIGTAVATVVLMLLNFILPQTDEIQLVIGAVIPSIILLFAGGLFIWITNETGRGTSASLAFMLITEIFGLPVLYFSLLDGPIGLVTLFIALMGPAMVGFAFTRPDQKITLELFGYGASFAGPALTLSSLQFSGAFVDPIILTISSMGVVAVLLAFGTGSYLYGRWTETRQIPTVLWSLAFIMFGTGQFVGMLGNLGMMIGDMPIYAEFILTGYALTLMAMGAIYAAGWKTASLGPLVVFLPISLLFIQAYPADLGATFLNLLYLAIPTLVIMILPSFLFFNVFRRMRSAKSPGRFKPLGVAVAIILFLLIRIPPMAMGIQGLDYGYGLVVISFAVFWTALTGRMDRIVGTI